MNSGCFNNKERKQFKIAFLSSHPIQYFAPLFREISEDPELELIVYFCSEEGSKEMKDIEFSTKFKWDIPLLDGYKYKILRNYSLFPSTHRKPFGLINPGIISQISCNKFDALIVHGWNYVTAWLSYAYAIFKKIPIILRAETPLNHELAKSKFKLFIKNNIMKRVLKRVDAFLAIGTQNKEYYRYLGIPDSKIFFAPYAVDNQSFIKKYNLLVDQRAEVRLKLGLPLDKFIILFVGKLIEKKKPMDLLKAYEKIECSHKALVFVGNGKLRNEMQNYVKLNKIKDVYFLGFINQSEMPQIYISSDLIVLPSSYGETWGLVINEAMCFHLPVIVSDIAGCSKDLVKHGINGYIYPTGDIFQLHQYIIRIINDEFLRRQMGDKSYEIISSWNLENNVIAIKKAMWSIRKKI